MSQAPKTDWSRYGYCDRCKTLEGRACQDLRYSWRTGTFDTDRPHRGRPRQNRGV